MRRFDTVYQNLTIARMTIDFPNVNSNSTITVDVVHAPIVLGTHIISWAPVTTATSMEDLIVTFMIVDAGLIRIIIQNPTGGAIDADSIDFEFVIGTANPDI